MASRGRKRQTIAQDLGVHRTTVRLWLKQYHERGVTGLQIHWARGQAGRIPEMLAPTIQAWVKDGLQSCGLDRANWTYEELATYLYQTTGIQGDRTILIIPLSWFRTGSTAASAAELEPGTRAHASVLQRLAACPTAPAWTPCQASERAPGPLRLSCRVLVGAAEKALCDRISSLIRMVRSPCPPSPF
jgi:hypothetical protein